MKPIPEILFKKLCYILHRGFVEARLLATHRPQQASDLADAFEIIPGYLPSWHEASLGMIRSHLHEYQDKYGPSPFDYLAILDMAEEEFMATLSRY
jgi:hypothetical protein